MYEIIYKSIKGNKKKKSWCPESEELLLEIWKQKIDEFRSAKPNISIRDEMAAELSKKGFECTNSEVKAKMYNMTTKFRKEKRFAALGIPTTWWCFNQLSMLVKEDENLPKMDEFSQSDKLELKLLMSRRKKNFWCPKSEKILLNMWQNKMMELRSTNRNSHIRDEIATELLKNGFVFTNLEIKRKMHNMLSKYRRERKVGSPTESPTNWWCYNQLNEMFGCDDNSNSMEELNEGTTEDAKQIEPLQESAHDLTTTNNTITEQQELKEDHEPIEEQDITLQCSDYFRRLAHSFNNFRSNVEFVDVTLSCEGRKLDAHKIVLSSNSNYFKRIFLENPHPHAVIIFKLVKFEILKSIIDFMYQGKVIVPENDLQLFFETAEMLEVQGITTEVKEQFKMTTNQESLTKSNLCSESKTLLPLKTNNGGLDLGEQPCSSKISSNLVQTSKNKKIQNPNNHQKLQRFTMEVQKQFKMTSNQESLTKSNLCSESKTSLPLKINNGGLDLGEQPCISKISSNLVQTSKNKKIQNPNNNQKFQRFTMEVQEQFKMTSNQESLTKSNLCSASKTSLPLKTNNGGLGLGEQPCISKISSNLVQTSKNKKIKNPNNHQKLQRFTMEVQEQFKMTSNQESLTKSNLCSASKTSLPLKTNNGGLGLGEQPCISKISSNLVQTSETKKINNSNNHQKLQPSHAKVQLRQESCNITTGKENREKFPIAISDLSQPLPSMKRVAKKRKISDITVKESTKF